MIKETIDLLGKKATDKVTGFSGTITSVSFDLYGCVSAILNPPCEAGKEPTGGHWYDVQRLTVSDERVMDATDFDASGKTPGTWDNARKLSLCRGFNQWPIPL